jgi:hypothetical protein
MFSFEVAYDAYMWKGIEIRIPSTKFLIFELM